MGKEGPVTTKAGGNTSNSRSNNKNNKRLCKFFQSTKGCNFGSKCRYSHDISTPKNIEETTANQDETPPPIEPVNVDGNNTCQRVESSHLPAEKANCIKCSKSSAARKELKYKALLAQKHLSEMNLMMAKVQMQYALAQSTLDGMQSILAIMDSTEDDTDSKGGSPEKDNFVQQVDNESRDVQVAEDSMKRTKTEIPTKPQPVVKPTKPPRVLQTLTNICPKKDLKAKEPKESVKCNENEEKHVTIKTSTADQMQEGYDGRCATDFKSSAGKKNVKVLDENAPDVLAIQLQKEKQARQNQRQEQANEKAVALKIEKAKRREAAKKERQVKLAEAARIKAENSNTAFLEDELYKQRDEEITSETPMSLVSTPPTPQCVSSRHSAFKAAVKPVVEVAPPLKPIIMPSKAWPALVDIGEVEDENEKTQSSLIPPPIPSPPPRDDNARSMLDDIITNASGPYIGSPDEFIYNLRKELDFSTAEEFVEIIEECLDVLALMKSGNASNEDLQLLHAVVGGVEGKEDEFCRALLSAVSIMTKVEITTPPIGETPRVVVDEMGPVKVSIANPLPVKSIKSRALKKSVVVELSGGASLKPTKKEVHVIPQGEHVTKKVAADKKVARPDRVTRKEAKKIKEQSKREALQKKKEAFSAITMEQPAQKVVREEKRKSQYTSVSQKPF